MAKFLSATALLVLLSATTATAQWAVKLPQPTGPYQIGTTSFALVDEARPEVFTDGTKDHRELLVRCWYPAQPGPGAKPEPFWGKDTKEVGQLLAEFMRMPKNAFDDLARVQSHAYTDAPLSRSKSSYRFPLVWTAWWRRPTVDANRERLEESSF